MPLDPRSADAHDGAVNLRRAILFVSFILLVAITTQAYRQDPRDRGPFQRTLVTLTSPVAYVFSGIGGFFGNIGEWVKSHNVTVERVAVLEDEVRGGQAALSRLEGLEAENRQLRDLLAVRATITPESVVARVIARNPGGGSRTLRINQGSSDGVAVGQPVLGGIGFLGQIVDVTRHTAGVLMATDRRSAVSVRIGPHAIPAIALGDGDRGLLLDGVPEQAREQVVEGMIVYAAGDDGLAWASTLLGTVEAVSDHAAGLFLDVRATPAEDLSAAQWVYVVVEPLHE